MNINCLFFLLLITVSCKSQYNSYYEFAPSDHKENTVTLAQIADDINYISLENQYAISVINHIKITNKSIFLSSVEGVFKFDRDGKMVTKIGSKGRGPGEYIYSNDFAVDDIHETIYIKDRNNIIKVYSKHGIFQREINLQEFVGGIDVIEFYNSSLFVSFYLQFGDSQYNWIIIDTLGSVIKKKDRTIPNFTSNWGAKSGTFYFENKLSYWNPYNDTVFSISPDMSYKISFLFKPGIHRLPKSNFDPENEITRFILIRTLFETSRFLVFRYSYNKMGVIAFIDKKSKKSFVTFVDSFDSGGMVNDLDGCINFQPRSYLNENGREYMIGFLEPYNIKAHVTNFDLKNSTPKYLGEKETFIKMANNLKETDNPVLVLVRLKK